MSSTTPERMPLEELMQTQEYLSLTGKQQLFIETFVGGGLVDGHYDAVSSILTAYECKSREVARIMSYSLMANIRIIAVLNRHFKTAPIEEFVTQLNRAINNKKLTIAQLQALKLKCDVLGFANRLPSPGKPASMPSKSHPKPKKVKAAPQILDLVQPSQYDDH